MLIRKHPASPAGKLETENMPEPKTTNRLELERNTLRLLCSVLIKPGTRIEISKLLDPSVFLDPLHRTVFEEICALGVIDAKRLRALLPEQVTNRGYPDFDLRELLAPNRVSEAEIEGLFESALKLLDMSDPGNEQILEL
jgi:hypothetical protein